MMARKQSISQILPLLWCVDALDAGRLPTESLVGAEATDAGGGGGGGGTSESTGTSSLVNLLLWTG